MEYSHQYQPIVDLSTIYKNNKMIALLVLGAVLASATASIVPVPLDPPEVALAKAQHLAIVEQTKLRNALGVSVVPGLAYAPGWNTWGAPVVVNGHVQDTPEVAAAKAKHLAIQASEAVRNNAGYLGVAHVVAPWGVWGGAPVSVVNGQVQDTPEVAAAKAQHIAALNAAAARAAHAW